MKHKLQRKEIIWSILLVLSIGICQFIPMQVYATGDTMVTELDLGDYQTEMKVGERQLLLVTPLPETAVNMSVTYTSSNTTVATINGMGRITALAEGVTEISVSCEQVSEKFMLTVVSSQNAVIDLDLGDCPSELEVGTSQVLSVTPIPTNASEYTITYTSADENKATVNALGRITAVAVGETKITVNCGKISKTFSVKVVESKDKRVNDIEIADYQNELEVDKTMTLSVTVLPSDAVNSAVTFQSSDERIATVSSTGEVKGIATGKVTIAVSVGDITKNIELTVKVATSKIELNTTYLVMQIGESYQLHSTVLPYEADQSITYKSMNSDIVTISSSGYICAKKCGNTMIVVKNKDTSAAVSVIVNAGEEMLKEKKEIEETVEVSKYDTVIYEKDCPLITSDMLRYYYENQLVVTIYGDSYSMQIDGKKILNWNNEMYTEIEFAKEEDGISFCLNQSRNMCGVVTLQVDEQGFSGKYLYLYNDSKNKYELIKQDNIRQLELNSAGKYLITEKKIGNNGIKWVIIIILLIILLALIITYTVIAKRYWFW